MQNPIIPVLLDRMGQIVPSNISIEAIAEHRKDLFPIVVEPYLWDAELQLESASIYKDQIMRVHYPEMTRPEQTAMLDDDRRRIEVVSGFQYGSSVLEVGSSDGTVSLSIARRPEVEAVTAIDIRPDAAEDGKRLVADLLQKGVIDEVVAHKFSIETASVIEYKERHEGKTFDVVCAYEIFEHVAPQDFLSGFSAAYQFLASQGVFYMSVPNRFPHPKYEEGGRARWKWFDHRNFFSKRSLEYFLSKFFENVRFTELYPGEEIEDGVYLIAECHNKLWK